MSIRLKPSRRQRRENFRHAWRQGRIKMPRKRLPWLSFPILAPVGGLVLGLIVVIIQ